MELTATKNGNGVYLTLTTTAEPDTAALLILRGDDLANGGTEINTVCQKSSKGSTDSGATYNCTDNAIGDTYRAAEIEYDGDFIVYDEITPQ